MLALKPTKQWILKMTAINITPKQWLYIKGYASHMNAEKAGRDAGYKRKQEWQRLMKKKHILDAINKEIAAKGIFIKPSVERILTELMRIAFFDPKELFHDDGTPKDLTEISEDARRCIAGIDLSLESRGKDEEPAVIRKYKIVDKHKALENLGRHLAMFNDKLKVDLPTELGQMTDEQIDSAISQLTSVVTSLSAAAGKAKTSH